MKVLYLEQWVKRFESHSKLVEAEGQAKIDAERRQFQVELDAMQAKGRQAPRVGGTWPMATRHWSW
jgi:hypothetical protein